MIPAHTSSFGLHSLYETQNYDWGPISNYGSAAYDATRSAKTAISNRPLPVKGNGVSALPYYRKIGRLWSLSRVDVKTSSHYLIADKSFGYRGISLYEVPYGSSYGSATVSLPKWMTDTAIQNCTLALQDIRANILEDFGQTKQTVSMLWGIFRDIVELFRLMWKRQYWLIARRLKRKRPKDAAQAWLMFYYGIKPMIGTMTALCDSQGPRVKTVSRRSRVKNPVDITGFVDGHSGSLQTSGRAEQRAQCGMTISVKIDSDLAYWSSLGLSDPSGRGGANDLDALVTMWALTPYSFVLDWVLPVERFLRTRTWGSGIDYQTGYVTKVLYGLGEVTDTNPMTGNGDGGLLPKVRIGCMQLQRLAYNNYAPPSGLSLKLSLTSTQAFNAVALIVART